MAHTFGVTGQATVVGLQLGHEIIELRRDQQVQASLLASITLQLRASQWPADEVKSTFL